MNRKSVHLFFYNKNVMANTLFFLVKLFFLICHNIDKKFWKEGPQR